MYGIKSVNKMFPSVAIMKLVDDGLVNLDAPVTKYISDFKMDNSGILTLFRTEEPENGK